MLSPCPFSKAYKIPIKQAWFLLKGFYFYRLILSCVFVTLYYSRIGGLIIDPHHVQLYLYSSLTYLFLTMVGWGLIFKRLIPYATLMHACGGIGSGIGALMLVPTAAGGLLIGGRCAMLFAALASLFVFAEQAYSFRMGDFNSSDYPYAGMMGAAFFSIALLSYILAKRTEQTELISTQQQATIVSLEELNQYIMQNMQSGIIITDDEQKITLYNESTSRLLGLSSLPETLAGISLVLASAFSEWLAKPSKNEVRIGIVGASNLHVHFSSLPTEYAVFFMLTLEDVALYNQRVQQSKLASLGQLTANIAHEIRNPLGAISHASQLLAECPALSPQDLRLTEIIQTHTLRMNSIIEEILQLSRRSDSKQEIILLESWLKSYLSLFASENSGYKNQFQLIIESAVPSALCDPGHLTQILNNLCENALKYGYKIDKKIEIKVSTHFNQPCIDVIDYGNGVAESDSKHLFEPFYTTSTSGTGLGLYLSRELAELNKAMLSYHDLAEQTGSCFRLCLVNAEQKKIEL